MNSRHNVQQTVSHAEEMLQTELRAVAECADAGLVIFDRAGRLQLTNRKFAQLMGFGPDEFTELATWEELSRKISTRLNSPDEFIEKWRSRMERLGEASWDEIQVERPVLRHLERFGRPIHDAAGKTVGRIENYREGLHEASLLTHGLQTDRLVGLGQIVSGIAHELNNPLTSITGYAQLLLSRPLPPHQTADAQRIFQEADRASHIVKNLLLFARDRRTEKRPVDLNEIVERTLALRNYELRVENIVLEVNLDRGLPLVLADPVQIQQVLLNLIINAEQAIEESSREGVIRVRNFRSEERVVLEVSDSGPGVPPEILGRVFDPFFTTKPAGIGTGLGLSLAQQILRDHSGRISAESLPGKGAKFAIELPISRQATIERLFPGPESTNVRIVPKISRREKVLIIEDEPTVAQLIEDVLADMGHMVETFLDGRQGLEHALSEDFGLLICDLKMPRVDGRMIYQELVRHHRPLQNRIVFITGDVLAARTMDFLESSGLPYLAKPFQVDDLKMAVSRVLTEPSPLSLQTTGEIRGAARS